MKNRNKGAEDFLVGGRSFGMFFLAEFVGTLFMSALFTTLYLGGYRFFGLENWVAADGYPGAYGKGSEIRGIEVAAALPDVQIFHAGTLREDGVVKANGGRVLNVTALGRDVSEAQARAYAAVDLIDWPEGFCRRDIGWRAIAREDT